MAPSDGDFGDDVDAAAAAYADLVDCQQGLDLVMLGMGDEGHVASIFPESPAVYDTRPAVAVRNCPKPPPTRISLTLPTIRRASEVWIITAAASKAGAVAHGVGGAGEVAVPAAGATGRARTLWLLDRQSASALPAGISRSPVPERAARVRGDWRHAVRRSPQLGVPRGGCLLARVRAQTSARSGVIPRSRLAGPARPRCAGRC